MHFAAATDGFLNASGRKKVCFLRRGVRVITPIHEMRTILILFVGVILGVAATVAYFSLTRSADILPSGAAPAPQHMTAP